MWHIAKGNSTSEKELNARFVKTAQTIPANKLNSKTKKIVIIESK